MWPGTARTASLCSWRASAQPSEDSACLHTGPAYGQQRKQAMAAPRSGPAAQPHAPAGLEPGAWQAHAANPSIRWETIKETAEKGVHREPWNKGKIVGQKAPYKVKDIWALRVRPQMEGSVREIAHFTLGIDSQLRGCDLVNLKVRDVCHGDQVATRATLMQIKTRRPVQFEVTPATREAVQAWVKQAGLRPEGFLFPSRNTTRRTSGRGSALESSDIGLTTSVWTAQTTARIRCAEPRRR